MAYIDLLDIEDTVGSKLIAEKIKDRHQYFSMLASTAPTAQLKSIYLKKLSELQELAVRYSVDWASPRSADAKAKTQSDGDAGNARYAEQELAMLVLHTEGRAVRSYQLLPGLNILGRSQGTEHHSIVIEDDFMSRSHAVVEITNVKARQALVYDIGEISGKKSSTNGVYLNGVEKRITGKTTFRPGDTIQVGYSKLVLTYSSAEKQKEAVTAVGKKDHSKTVFIKVS